MTESSAGELGVSETPISVLERLRSHPEEADWNRVVHLYTRYIERWLKHAGVPFADAADLTQDVVATLVREIPRFEHSGRPGAFRKWLRRLVLHRTLGYWRKRRARGTSLEQVRAAEVLRSLEDRRTELADRFDAEHDAFVLQRLMELIEPGFTTSTWEAFRGQAIENRAAADVAAELGLTVNAVLVAKSRVLKRLRSEAAGLLD
jgi:RNA polymerase sigma factor (sigma-70 family)